MEAECTFQLASGAMSAWVTVLRVVTSIFQLGMTLSPGPDILNVVKHKTTGDVAALPLVAMVVNNHLWYLLSSTGIGRNC
jgi:hypothetical protein